MLLRKEEAAGLIKMNRQDIEHQVSMQFRKTDQMLRRCLERRVKSTGVYSSQHRILMHLNVKPNSTQAELAERLEVSPAAIAVSVKKLEKGGYIIRKPDVSDCRALQVIITQKGRHVIEQSISIFQTQEKEMFAGFTDVEMQQLSGFFERMYRNLDEIRKTEEL